MPTIKDIAAEAGVSHGTVSNVINGRGNVSVEKIQKVWKAAEKLGYKLNTKAQTLRQGQNKAIAVLLPGIDDPRFAAVYEELQKEFSVLGYTVQLYLTHAQISAELSVLTEALNNRVSAVIVRSCLSDAPARYLCETQDTPVIFLQQNASSSFEGQDKNFTEQKNRMMFAGFHPEHAGAEIAQFLKNEHAEHIGLFTEKNDFPDTSLFLNGFYSVFPKENPNITLVSCTEHQIDLKVFDFFNQDIPYDYIVCTDKKRESAFFCAHSYASSEKKPLSVTITPKNAMEDTGRISYELDYKRLAFHIVQVLHQHLAYEKSLPPLLKMSNSGFRTKAPVHAYANDHLRLLTISSPSTTALGRLLPNLRKQTGIHLDMTVLPSLRDLYDVLKTPAHARYDLIRIDVAWMKELAAKLFLPLSAVPFDWDHLLSKTLPEFGSQYTSIHREAYCIPYDPSVQVLFYRKDLFENPTYKRMFFEMHRKELNIPHSFAEYNTIAKFFTQKFNPDSPIRYGSTVAIGNVVVSPSEFLTRLYSLNGDILNEKGEISLCSDAALEALEGYKDTYSYSDPSIHYLWKNALEGFTDGNAAMTIVFTNYASHILNSKMADFSDRVGCASVPGDHPVLGGGVLGITRECKNIPAVCTFFTWLYSGQISPVFTMLGGLSPCRSAYHNRDVNEKYPWLSAARKAFAHARARNTSELYDNFSELQLENILATNLQDAVLSHIPVREALEKAQQESDAYFTRSSLDRH